MLTTGGGGDPVAVDDFSNLVALGSDGETVGINIDGGNDTISGGTGPDVIVGGQRGGNVIVAGSDPETILGSDATNILCRTDLHPAAISLGGGTHRVAAGLEPSFIQAGSGNSTVFAGDGSGSASGDVVAFMNGTAGGTELIAGFHVGSDLLALRGHAGSGTMAGLAGCQVAGGSTVLTLADDTRVTLQSVTDLGPSSFLWGRSSAPHLQHARASAGGRGEPPAGPAHPDGATEFSRRWPAVFTAHAPLAVEAKPRIRAALPEMPPAQIEDVLSFRMQGTDYL